MKDVLGITDHAHHKTVMELEEETTEYFIKTLDINL